LLVSVTWQDRRSPFDASFTGATMRVDYFHTGGPTSGETIALDRVVDDGDWPGSRTQLVDATNLGKYRFEVRNKRTQDLMYSRGFASIYGEWETTAEQKTLHRTFHESLRFPWPREPIVVTLSKRQADNSFASIWTTGIDPDRAWSSPRRSGSTPAASGRCSSTDLRRRRSTCW
jgi:hypothetical protein